MTSRGSKIGIVEVDDEDGPVASRVYQLIESTFAPQDRQPTAALRSEIEERRRRLPTTQDYHALAALDAEGRVIGAITGMYLGGVNAGFVTYLAVEPESRRGGTGRLLRRAIVKRFRADAAEAGMTDLRWVVGEVRITSPWLRRLVRNRGAIPFDLTYYHPGVEPPEVPIHALYRQPVTDDRRDLPARLVLQIVYAIYRRGYRVRYPLMHAGFRAMLDEVAGRHTVGLHPRFAGLVEKNGGAP